MKPRINPAFSAPIHSMAPSKAYDDNFDLIFRNKPDPIEDRLRIYLSGPMRNKPYFNFPEFFKQADFLRRQGHEVFCPAEEDVKIYGERVYASPSGLLSDIDPDIKFSLREALLRDCVYICETATAIALLPGWENSKGATAEHALAIALGHKVILL